MKKILAIASALAICVAFSFAAKKAPGPVNDKCPISGKAVNADQTVDVGVCCGKCAKKVAADPKLVCKTKGDFTKCPVSGKPAKKNCIVKIGFCCAKCKGKVTSS